MPELLALIAAGIARGLVNGLADALADRLPAIVASWRTAWAATITDATPNPKLEGEIQDQIDKEIRDGKVF